MSKPDYLTDVPYLRGFIADLSPARLRLVAALNGFLSPAPEDFDYCELGAGHGDTLVTLAAAYPRARFVGVDLLPEHIATARELATQGDLSNVQLLQCDFADLAGRELPQFDYIVAHGVLSWIGPDKRQALLELASSRLKPGGLLYVGYNALPGWAALEPLRRLLADRAVAVKGDVLERARLALGLAKGLGDAAADYFTENPSAKELLTTVAQVGLPYIAHEFLQTHWTPMYFADVAYEMAAKELYFIGQLPLYLNFRDLAIAPSLLPIFQSVTDRVAFESLLGYALNQSFRRDVYFKGKVTHSSTATHAYLDSTVFGALSAAPMARSVALPHYTLQFVGKVFDVLLPFLGQGATTISALLQHSELSGFSQQTLRDAIMRLLICGQLSPLLRPTRAIQEVGTGLCRVPLAYNRMLLQRRLTTGTPIALASCAAGTGIAFSMLQGVALRLLTEVAPADRPLWIGKLLETQPFRIKMGDSTIDDDKTPAGALLEEVERFRVQHLPKLLELGILEQPSTG